MCSRIPIKSAGLRRPRCARRAFTLIELLVVISVVALLTSLLLPALGKARASARTVQCQVKLRSLGQASIMYSSDFAGLAPRVESGNAMSPAAWTGWDFALAPYIGARFINPWNNRGTLKPHPVGLGHPLREKVSALTSYCPSFQRAPDHLNHTPQGSWGDSDIATWVKFWGIGSYRMNGWLGLYGQSIHNNRNYQLAGPRAAMWEMRPGTFLFSEAYNHGGYTSRNSIYYNPEHDGRAPMVFADGHVAMVQHGNIPNTPAAWTINASHINNTEMSTFWGFYLLKYYANPATEVWESP